MKKTAIFAVIILLLFPCLSVFAESGGFYCEYTSKTATGSLFYVDVVASQSTSAAVFELDFDESMVEFRSVTAIDKSCNVRSRVEDNTVYFAFASDPGSSGKICRTTFKSTGTGECAFTLRAAQAADDKLNYFENTGSSILTLNIGKDDIKVVSSTKNSGKTNTSTKSKTDSKDENISDTDGDGLDENAYNGKFGGIIDLRSDKMWVYVLLGVCITAFIVSLVCFGIYIGKKSAKKQSSKSTKTEEQIENLPDTTTDNSDDNPETDTADDLSPDTESTSENSYNGDSNNVLESTSDSDSEEKSSILSETDFDNTSAKDVKNTPKGRKSKVPATDTFTDEYEFLSDFDEYFADFHIEIDDESSILSENSDTLDLDDDAISN